MQDNALLRNCSHVTRVSSEEEVLTHPFSASTNAVYYQRVLEGDFDSLAIHLKQSLDLGEHALKMISNDELKELCEGSGSSIQLAQQAISKDLILVGSFCSSVSLRVISGHGYDPASAPAGLHHDFYSAVQRKNGSVRRALCSYNKPAAEGARNQDVERISPKSASYRLKNGCSTFSTGLMNLWSFATYGENSNAPAFIHKPGIPEPGCEIPRLVLIGR